MLEKEKEMNKLNYERFIEIKHKKEEILEYKKETILFMQELESFAFNKEERDKELFCFTDLDISEMNKFKNREDDVIFKLLDLYVFQSDLKYSGDDSSKELMQDEKVEILKNNFISNFEHEKLKNILNFDISIRHNKFVFKRYNGDLDVNNHQMLHFLNLVLSGLYKHQRFDCELFYTSILEDFFKQKYNHSTSIIMNFTKTIMDEERLKKSMCEITINSCHKISRDFYNVIKVLENDINYEELFRKLKAVEVEIKKIMQIFVYSSMMFSRVIKNEKVNDQIVNQLTDLIKEHIHYFEF